MNINISQYNPNNQVNLKKEYTSENLTSYSGSLDLYKFMENLSIPQILDTALPTRWHSATKFSNAQILLSACLASLCDTNRLSNIERFTADPLISILLDLPKHIDEDTLSYRLKQLGESGARQLTESLFRLYSSMLSSCGFEDITISSLLTNTAYTIFQSSDTLFRDLCNIERSNNPCELHRLDTSSRGVRNLCNLP